jgi:hypothetical protein
METKPTAASSPHSGALEKSSLAPTVALRVQAEGDLGMEKSLVVYASAGNDMHISAGQFQAAVAGRDIAFTGGKTAAVVAGRDITLDQGWVGATNAGGDVRLDASWAGAVSGSQVTAQSCTIGLALSRQVNVGGGSRVLLSTPQAAALGAALGTALGLTLAVARWLMPGQRRNTR